MVSLLDAATNRPGGLFHLAGSFEWVEGETLNLRLQLVEYEGGPPIDCTGWTVKQAGLYGNPRNPVPGDLGVGVVCGLSTDGVFTAVGGLPVGAAPAAQYPAGRPAWLFVIVTDGTYDVYLLRPSPIVLRQGPGAGS